MPALKQTHVRRAFSPEFKWQIVQETKEQILSVSELARKYDVNTNQVFRWVREVNLGKALWVRRVKGEAETATSLPFFPIRAVDTVSALRKPAITVSFRRGHQLLLHEATPAMLVQLCWKA